MPRHSGDEFQFCQHHNLNEKYQYHMHMGQKLQDGKKVLEMSVTILHSKCLLPSWISILRAPAQEFSPSWNARKHAQEGLKFPEIPGNLYFQKNVRKPA